MDAEAARQSVEAAIDELETAAAALEDTEGKTDEEVKEAERSFELAEAELRKSQTRLERVQLINKAKGSLPAPPSNEGRSNQTSIPAPGTSTNTLDVKVTKEELTYRKGDHARSYFRDLVWARRGDGESQERLQRHAAEMRDLSRTDGAGGEFIPPKWMQEDFAILARAGRPLANAIGSLPLPAGTDSINVPKIATGTATAIQTADNAAVTETDATTSSVSAPVRTIAGQQDVAIQALEQSVPGLDEVIRADLIADYAAKFDAQVVNGSGASGQVTGILNTSSITSVTYTDASPTVPEAYPKFADAIQQIHTTRFLPPELVVMHPRRWGWILAALDSANRPLVSPYAPQNAAGLAEQVGSENIVGQIHGLPVLVDANIPTNLGAGTNEDRILVIRHSDYRLWESEPRFRVMEEVLSANLTVRLQVYGYLAFTAARFEKSTAVISGTGLVAPTF